MATLLLLIIYLAFIGLGIPDSLFGAAWPAIYADFSLPVSYASLFSMLSTACTFVASLISAAVINRFGTARVTACSTALTALCLLAMGRMPTFWHLLVLAIPLGLGGGAVDAALNNYVALHYSARQMNFLHCFYGVGVSVSPYLLSFALGGAGGWRGGFGTVAYVQVGIAAVTVLSLPLWRRVAAAPGASDAPAQDTPRTLPLAQQLHLGGLPAMWLMFLAACAVEVCSGVWGSTYLVQHRGLGADAAAGLLALYYAGLACGRFVSGLLAGRLDSRTLVLLALATVALAVVTLALPLGAAVAGLGLFLAGFGIGPVYPNLMHLTPIFFGRDVSQSVMGTQMAAASLGVLLGPALFGPLAQSLGAGCLPYYLAGWVALLAVGVGCSALRKPLPRGGAR